MLLQNVRIYTGNQTGKGCGAGFRPGSIEITGDRIAAIWYDDEQQPPMYCPPYAQQVIDGRGGYAIPGMIDLHFHGCGGDDVCDLSEQEEDSVTAMWQRIAEYQASIGVTGMAPALMTLPAEGLIKTLTHAATFAKSQQAGSAGGALLNGINMEGPFISHARCGAQDASFLLPCEEGLLQQFLDAAEGLVKIVGIAPEKTGALYLIRKVTNQVKISLAHTDADYETAKLALEAGACHITHLFNAMPPLHHRAPGVVGAALEAVAEGRELMAELICDGIHVHPAMIRAAFTLFGADHIVLISDSIRAAGMPDGEYLLGGQLVKVQGRRAELKKDGALAGSVTSLPDCVRIAVREAGIPLKQAIACATINPAKVLGIAKEQGSIEAGKRADLVLWNEELEQQMVICGGKIIEGSGKCVDSKR